MSVPGGRQRSSGRERVRRATPELREDRRELPAGRDVELLRRYLELPGDRALTIGRMFNLLRILAVFMAILASLAVAFALPAFARELAAPVGYGISAVYLALASFVASLFLLIHAFLKPVRWYRSNLAQRSRDEATRREASPAAAQGASPPLAVLDARLKPAVRTGPETERPEPGSRLSD